MAHSTEYKILIRAAMQKKGYGARKIIADFPDKTWTLSGLSYAYKKSRPQARCPERRRGSRTKPIVSTRENIESIQELVLSQ